MKSPARCAVRPACAVKFLNTVECPSSQGVLHPERELPGITAAHVVTDEIKKAISNSPQASHGRRVGLPASASFTACLVSNGVSAASRMVETDATTTMMLSFLRSQHTRAGRTIGTAQVWESESQALSLLRL